MKNKFEIGDVVYFICGDKVCKETVKWIREQRYFGVNLNPSYEYATDTVSYISENKLHKNIESLFSFHHPLQNRK